METPERRRLSLTEAAERLGVHYMTVYRYVRIGEIEAVKDAGRWWVSASAVTRRLDRDKSPRSTSAQSPNDAPWDRRLLSTLLAGDETASWRVVEAALAGGRGPDRIHEELVVPAMRRVGDLWESGAIGVGEEHIATAIATRILGRLSAMFRTRGRHGKRVVVGTPPGDRHNLPVMMVADQLRGAGFDVIDLGCDIPVSAFCKVVGAAETSAVAIGVTLPEALIAAQELIEALRDGFGGIPIVLGGAAVSPSTAERFGADAFAATAPGAVDACRRLVG